MTLLSMSNSLFAQDNIGDNCLDANEFKIGEFFYGQDSSQILEILGIPDSVILEEYTPSKIWKYSDIWFGISNAHIYYISTTSDRYSTPSGIKINMSMNRIAKLLDKDISGRLYADKSVQFVDCYNSHSLILEFNSNKVLTKLEIGIDLP